MRVPVRRQGKLSGFTLVEMAIVLVIIGIILAGVMKGRDIVRSSQVKQFAQSFASKWVTIAQTYYDKSGQMLTDGSVNGGTATVSDGRMDGILVGGGTPTATQRDRVLAYLKNIGIDPCTIVKTDVENLTTGVGTSGGCPNGMNPFERNVDGEITGKVRGGVGFACFLVTQNSIASVRNAVYLVDIPLDVAISMDTIIDGSARGNEGSYIYAGPTTLTTSQGGVVAAWSGGGSTAIAVTATSWPTFITNNPQYVDPIILLDN